MQTLQSIVLAPCQALPDFVSSISVKNSSLLASMPGSSITLSVGICDAFGNRMPTIIGATVEYMFNTSLTLPSVSRTSSVGLAPAVDRLPVIPSGSEFVFSSEFGGRGSGLSLPSRNVKWKSMPCSPFYGFSPSLGCSLCSPSEFSLFTALRPCMLCSTISTGASCVSRTMLRSASQERSLLSSADNSPVTVTVIHVESGYWPALQLKSIYRSPIVPILCPFNYCVRSKNDLYILGIDEETSTYSVSDSSLICNADLFRDPSSLLCGQCVEGYSEWNYRCYHCPHGPQPQAVILFVLQLIGWTFLQFLLAQRGGSVSATALLILLTQSLSWFIYPSSLFQSVESLVNFRFLISSTTECFVDVNPLTALFLRVIVPFLYFVTLWIFYVVHVCIAACLSTQHSSHKTSPDDKTSRSMCSWLSDMIVRLATPSPYLKTTALLILATYPSILDAIFSVWSCLDVPVSPFLWFLCIYSL